MTLKEASEILANHNKWRRGADIEPDRPTLIGEAIDKVVDFLTFKSTSVYSDSHVLAVTTNGEYEIAYFDEYAGVWRCVKTLHEVDIVEYIELS